MPTTLFEAPQYDPVREKRRKQKIAGALALLIILIGIAWLFRNYPEERVVGHFFSALKNKDFEKAYGIWVADANWKQHSQEHKRYPFNEFLLDWGPSGEWGVINSYKIDGTTNPKGGSGVIVQVTINDRKEPARVWVEKSDKSLTFSPY
ncbi:MAG: hypothetical protein ACE14M_00180 [Terriglobales bacterium]